MPGRCVLACAGRGRRAGRPNRSAAVARGRRTNCAGGPSFPSRRNAVNTDRRLGNRVTDQQSGRRDPSRSRRAQTVAMAAAIVPLAVMAGVNALRAEGPSDARAVAPRPSIPILAGMSIQSGAPKFAVDQPKTDAELLRQGADQYAAKQYEEAQVSLQQVKADGLSGDDKKLYDDLIGKAASAADQRKAARAAFDQGEQARAAGKAAA